MALYHAVAAGAEAPVGHEAGMARAGLGGPSLLLLEQPLPNVVAPRREMRAPPLRQVLAQGQLPERPVGPAGRVAAVNGERRCGRVQLAHDGIGEPESDNLLTNLQIRVKSPFAECGL